MRIQETLAHIRSDHLLTLTSILAVIGPIIVVSAGMWDAISHLQQEPEFFWSTPHIIVYTGVSITTCAAILGSLVLYRRSTHRILKLGIRLVIAGSIVQLVSGFGDSISHDLFGIDGLVSWSHQPLESGLVLATLGAILIIKGYNSSQRLLPLAAVSFISFTTWLAFNLVLIFGHVIQCLPVYQLFSSGCAIL